MWRRALKDTLPELVNSKGKVIRNLLFLGIALFLVRWFGGSEQMSEEARWLLSSASALIIVLVGLFLFNLIRAPVYLKFEKGQLQRIHVELWGYGTHMLPDRSGRIGYLAYSIRLTISNNSESTPLGIAKFVLGGIGLALPLDPIYPSEIDGFYGFGFTDNKDIEAMPHNIYLQPKESKTGQLAFVTHGKIEKQKLYITDESGTTGTINIDGQTLQKMGQRRHKATYELQ